MEIKAKKSLGQNWLKSKTALSKMIEVGEINPTDIIVEVGPGQGALTEKLLEKAQKVIAIEKDYRLIEFLKEKFSQQITEDKLILLSKDILEIEPEKFKLFDKKYKIIANIPYYITGLFLRKFLEETTHQPERIVVMVQKEIAQRIVANKQAKEKESLLSVSVKAYGTPKLIMKVDKENFSPPPKVDSAILLISNISKKFFTDNQITEKDFFTVLHAGFAHKRKILSSNLKNVVSAEKLSALEKNIRAEDLSLADWLTLFK